ncbi:PAS/PAC sensor-containing diguanylate cyclase/phosphodiesterase [Candidatus Magnetobacterium bavaricum]|uniref:PAS/PAC sensor-containing diguanylate cyclase/phosphodiesterase n=1 Tax=Candidatus Magnetobacterium bavaricum TaxID=29290 RepID=A0A0F3GHH9_9BACT|nr:PAS/PAC sensor-containing diguanylate cyclase/phosphodiesterase [Candidatus Magnetobacterium bavaricum]
MKNSYKFYIMVSTGFIVFLSMMVLLISIGRMGLDSNYKELDKIISVSSLKMDMAQEMRYLIRNEAVLVRNALVDDVNRADEIRRINENRKRYEEVKGNLVLLSSGRQVGLLIEQMSRDDKLTRQLWDNVIGQAQSGNIQEGYRTLVREVRPIQWKWLDTLDRIATLERSSVKRDYRMAYDAYIHARDQLTIVGILTVIIGIVIATVITIGISRPLKAVIIERTAVLEAINEQLKGEVFMRQGIEEDLRLSMKESREVKQMVESIMHGITDEIFLITRDYKIVWANESALGKYGYELGEIMGKFCYEVTHQKESPCGVLTEPCVFDELQQGMKSKTVEHVHVSRDGKSSLMEVTVYPIVDEKGDVSRVVHVSRDITERVKMQEQVMVLFAAVEQSPVAVVITDITGKIEYVNPQFTKMTHYKLDEVSGQTLAVLKSGKHPQEFYRELWHTILAGKVWHGSMCNKRRNGELYWENQNISPIKNQSGQITHFVAVKTDDTERKRIEEQLYHMANYDTLTDLPNRTLFYERLSEVLKISKRYEHKFAIMFVDLDNFKIVNDVYGHDVGDQLLREAANRLRDCVRTSDTVARMGGDEFTVILSRISKAEDAILIADYIIEALSKPFHLAGNDCFIGTSIGISVFPSDGEDAELLVANADVAMYHVKNSGKNAYRFYSTLEDDLKV